VAQDFADLKGKDRTPSARCVFAARRARAPAVAIVNADSSGECAKKSALATAFSLFAGQCCGDDVAEA
jgi:hypothetical protein